MRAAVLFLLTLVLPLPAEERYRVSTVAGEWSNLNGHYSGDGGPAARARVASPGALAWGPQGDLYLADTGNGAVRAINSAGIIRTVVGGRGSRADSLAPDHDLVFDHLGNLYFCEGVKGRIRRVSRDGAVTTIAGDGKLRGREREGRPATAAAISWPVDVHVDRDGSVFFRESQTDEAWKVASDGLMRLLPAPANEADALRRIQPPRSATDRQGNLYVVDRHTRRVLRVDPTGHVTPFAGREQSPASGTLTESGEGGPALDAILNPLSVALDSEGRLLISGGSIWRVEPDGRLTHLLGIVTRPSAPFDYAGLDPRRFRLTWDTSMLPDSHGNLYLSERPRHRVLKLSKAGELTTVVGLGEPPLEQEGGPAISARFAHILEVVAQPDGQLLVLDTLNDRVFRISQKGTIHRVAGTGSSTKHRRRIVKKESFSGDGGPATLAELSYPAGMAADSEGNVYLADSGNHRLRRISARDGRIETIAGGGEVSAATTGISALKASLQFPHCLARDRRGNLYFADGLTSIRKLDPQGIIHSLPDLPHASRLALDPQGTLHALDRDGRKIWRLEQKRGWQALSGPAFVGLQALSLTFDSAGNLYVGELGRLLRITKGGRSEVIAGGDSRQFVEEGPALGGAVYPYSIVCGPQGDIYFAEPGLVRKLTKLPPLAH